MSAEPQPQRRCAACGKLIGHEVLICPYCDAVGEIDEMTQLDAQVSNAINIRRMTIVVILAVIVTVGTTLVALINSVFVTDLSDELVLLKMWLAFAVLIMIVGVLVIIFNKRLTRPSGQPIWKPVESEQEREED